jgi:transcriptional regulator with XRE-family HTH domain
MAEDTPARMTANQLVAFNLRYWREERGWTQAEMVDRLEPFLGERWTRAAYSAAERSSAGKRIRHFDADDLYAFARVLGVPLGTFFVPPPSVNEVAPPEATETADRMTAFDLAFGMDDEVMDRTLELTGETIASLRRWTNGYLGALSKRQAEVEALFRGFDRKPAGEEKPW